MNYELYFPQVLIKHRPYPRRYIPAVPSGITQRTLKPGCTPDKTPHHLTRSRLHRQLLSRLFRSHRPRAPECQQCTPLRHYLWPDNRNPNHIRLTKPDNRCMVRFRRLQIPRPAHRPRTLYPQPQNPGTEMRKKFIKPQMTLSPVTPDTQILSNSTPPRIWRR